MGEPVAASGVANGSVDVANGLLGDAPAEDAGATVLEVAAVDEAGAVEAAADDDAGVAAADVAAVEAEGAVEVLAAGVLELLPLLLEQPVATRLIAAAATRRAVGRRLTIARISSPFR